jgi:hypothetical protein
LLFSPFLDAAHRSALDVSVASVRAFEMEEEEEEEGEEEEQSGRHQHQLQQKCVRPRGQKQGFPSRSGSPQTDSEGTSQPNTPVDPKPKALAVADRPSQQGADCANGVTDGDADDFTEELTAADCSVIFPESTAQVPGGWTEAPQTGMAV